MDEEELGETEREGVRMEFLVSPLEVLSDGAGKVVGVKFVRNRLGEPDATGRRAPVPVPGTEFIVKAQTVIPAVRTVRIDIHISRASIFFPRYSGVRPIISPETEERSTFSVLNLAANRTFLSSEVSGTPPLPA